MADRPLLSAEIQIAGRTITKAGDLSKNFHQAIDATVKNFVGEQFKGEIWKTFDEYGQEIKFKLNELMIKYFNRHLRVRETRGPGQTLRNSLLESLANKNLYSRSGSKATIRFTAYPLIQAAALHKGSAGSQKERWIPLTAFQWVKDRLKGKGKSGVMTPAEFIGSVKKGSTFLYEKHDTGEKYIAFKKDLSAGGRGSKRAKGDKRKNRFTVQLMYKLGKGMKGQFPFMTSVILQNKDSIIKNIVHNWFKGHKLRGIVSKGLAPFDSFKQNRGPQK